MFDEIQKIEKRLLRGLESDYKRYLYHRIDFDSRLIGIVGARGVGKTTLLLQYIHQLKKEHPPHKSLYFSYDYPTITDTPLFEIAEAFAKLGGEFLIVDEIHKYKRFALDLKAIYDFYPHMHVVFSGSSALSIYNAQADLSRRVVLYTMQGLSYREFLEMKLSISLPSYPLEAILDQHIDMVNKLEEHIVPLEYFSEYMTYGYYPFYFQDPAQYLRLLAAVINQTIEIDLVQLGLVKPSFVNKLKKLLALLAESHPFELNITKLATHIEASRNTVYSYLDLLDRSGLLRMVAGVHRGLGKLSKPEKLYLNNTNLFYALSNDVNIGTLRETFFVSQLNALHQVEAASSGDFLVDGTWTFEVGGKKKGFGQIKDMKDSYLVIDTDSTEHNHKVPLWLFGFLY